MMRFSASLLLLLVAACGGESLAPPLEGGMRIVRGASQSDTVAAMTALPLVVEVHDTRGGPVPTGTIVRFTATNAVVTQLDDNVAKSVVESGVDASGRAGVYVRLGTVAGSAMITITVPTLALADTAKYTILPGSPWVMSLNPLDTLVRVGSSFRMRGAIGDRYGNLRQDSITWSADPTATLTSDGTLTVPSIGLYYISAKSIVGTVTVQVRSVPNGRLAVMGDDGSILLTDFDGANVRALTPAASGVGPSVQWMPTRDAVVYSASVGGTEQLYVTDTLGVTRPFFASAPPNVSNQLGPSVTADGQWLIFGSNGTRCKSYCLYRARIDGTGVEVLSSNLTGSNLLFAPSPDGSRIAVFTPGSGVQMFDVATKTLSSWVLSTASVPAWSPDGSKIAVIQSAGLALFNPDGSLIRLQFTFERLASEPLTWLPDSRFLLARPLFWLSWDLIDTETGREFAIPGTAGGRTLSVR
jgi:hypothetical protein